MAELITLHQTEINHRYSTFLPDVVRVREAGFEFDTKGGVRHIAAVSGESFQATLTWHSACPDERITKGALARVFWPEHFAEIDGLCPINRLVPITVVDHGINLFGTVPTSWSRQFSLLDRAQELWNQLSPNKQALFNELFWEVERFRHYMLIPASINSHHNGWGGNLRHAVEMAEHAERIALDVEGVSNDLLILAGLLYNAPLADAYAWKEGEWVLAGPAEIQASRSGFEQRLSEILERRPKLLTENEHKTLWQILFRHPGGRKDTAPAPLVALEMEILRMADRLSCVLNLHGQGGLQ